MGFSTSCPGCARRRSPPPTTSDVGRLCHRLPAGARKEEPLRLRLFGAGRLSTRPTGPGVVARTRSARDAFAARRRPCSSAKSNGCSVPLAYGLRGTDYRRATGLSAPHACGASLQHPTAATVATTVLGPLPDGLRYRRCRKPLGLPELPRGAARPHHRHTFGSCDSPIHSEETLRTPSIWHPLCF